VTELSTEKLQNERTKHLSEKRLENHEAPTTGTRAAMWSTCVLEKNMS